MKLEAGRSKLYDLQKQIRGRWEDVCKSWHDPVQDRFREDIWEPLDQLMTETLRSIDQLRIVFREMQSDCGRENQDF